MKKLLFIVFLFAVKNSFAQKEIATTIGLVYFEASVPLFEEVAATNKTVSCVLNLKTGEITSVVKMNEFRFKLSLMEEHFNQKYLETNYFPNATLKGKIEGFNINIIDENSKEFKLNGVLKIHGKSKKISILVKVKNLNKTIEISSNFNLSVKDFDIKIPEILSMKVAEVAKIQTLFVFEKPILAHNP
ncbi:YceI family protein [Flavobacterium alvei]|uniref:YceI family protein n=1 Tax=Flavobacterium alvei TaxID=2080416 RepID=UPI0026EB00CE|nr:YceI family protein [Flavobacterium alvei]